MGELVTGLSGLVAAIVIGGQMLIDQNDAGADFSLALATDRNLPARIDQLVPYQRRVIADLQAREGGPRLQEHDRRS